MTIDKYKHVVVSAAMSAVLALVLPWWAAALVALVIGVAKEIYDKVSGRGCAEWGDLLADVVGIVIGVL